MVNPVRDYKAHSTQRKKGTLGVMKNIALAGAMSALLGTATHAGCDLSGGNANILGNEFGAIQAGVAGAKEYAGDVVTVDANLTKVHRDPQVAALTAKIAAVAPPSEDPDSGDRIRAADEVTRIGLHLDVHGHADAIE